MGFFNEYIKISPLPLVFLDEEMYTKKRIKFTTEDKDISFDFTDKPRPFIINKAYYKIFVFSEDHVKRYGFKFYRQIFCENINQFDIPQLMNQKIQSMTISYFDINSNLKKELKILCQ